MRTPTTLALATLALAACVGADAPAAPEAFDAFASQHADGPPMWEVRITNLTESQPLTPPIIATHSAPSYMFEVGSAASVAVKEIAENGNLAPMMDRLGTRVVADWTVAFGAQVPPVLPGEEVVTVLRSNFRARLISFVSMLVCTNDGFTGINSVALPGPGQSVTLYTNGYDAGTEINTEDFADIVPPCPVLTGVPSTDAGTGVSNPALAENGVIHHHPGVLGGDDLNPSIHGWSDPVAMIVITRIH